jgi:hypothetical protein
VGGSTLTRDLAIDAIAFINSGRLLPESGGILGSAGIANVLPGTSAAFPSFAEFVASAYESIGTLESPVEPLAQTYADIIAQGSGLPEGSAFDLAYLDALLAGSLQPVVIISAIDSLGLAPAS